MFVLSSDLVCVLQAPGPQGQILRGQVPGFISRRGRPPGITVRTAKRGARIKGERVGYEGEICGYLGKWLGYTGETDSVLGKTSGVWRGNRWVCRGNGWSIPTGEADGVHRGKRAPLIGDGFCQWLVVDDSEKISNGSSVSKVNNNWRT